MRVRKVANIVGGHINCSCSPASQKHLTHVLTSQAAVDDADAAYQWDVDWPISTGPSRRIIRIPVPIQISRSDSKDEPVFICRETVVYFQKQLFLPDHRPRDEAEREEIVLRVKKTIYVERIDIQRLKSAVANIEAAIEYQKTGPKRSPIPEDVKLAVWTRHGGACVMCNSKENLQFDHIIPVAKGGSNTVENIQLLCQPCNLRKSDSISM